MDQWLRLANSEETNIVGVSLHLPEDRTRFIFQNVVFSGYLDL
jgi:hypothetical protein